MKTSQETNELFKALAKAQETINHASKDGQNPHFRSKYATLESVIDATKIPLLNNKLLIIQSTTATNTLLTRLVHSESSQFIETETNLMMEKNDMQKLGSAITYARRYAISSMLNIAQEDDDGNLASKREPVVLNKKSKIIISVDFDDTKKIEALKKAKFDLEEDGNYSKIFDNKLVESMVANFIKHGFNIIDTQEV